MSLTRVIAILSTMTALAGCGPESGVAFRLPDGDAQRGREAFVALGCHACHVIEGFDAPFTSAGAAQVALGGKTTRVRTYGELVTSIINPSHRIAPRNAAEGTAPDGTSLMEHAYLNDVLTVQQLIDLVAFLQATYEVVPPPISPYAFVYPVYP